MTNEQSDCLIALLTQAKIRRVDISDIPKELASDIIRKLQEMLHQATMKARKTASR